MIEPTKKVVESVRRIKNSEYKEEFECIFGWLQDISNQINERFSVISNPRKIHWAQGQKQILSLLLTTYNDADDVLKYIESVSNKQKATQTMVESIMKSNPY